jgi:type IV secretory pathway VirB4 component
MPEILRPFFYAQAIGAVLRFMTDASRDLQRKTMLQIDEFGYLMQIEALANLAATVCKVARKFGVALVVVDQNPDTFFGSEAGRRIAENCNQKVLFHLDDLPARRMGEAIADLTPEHIEFVSHAEVGQALAVLGNDVYVLLVEPSPREAHVLRGS